MTWRTVSYMFWQPGTIRTRIFQHKHSICALKLVHSPFGKNSRSATARVSNLRSKSPDKDLRRAKNAVRGAFNVPKASYLELTHRYGKPRLSTTDLIFGGLSKLGDKDAKQFLDWINGFPSKALQIYPTRNVEQHRELVLGDVKVQLPLLARLYWLSIFLEHSRENLGAFVRLSNEFEQHFLPGQFEKAQATLDEVKAIFGLSVWLIETQIALLQRWKGLEAQKEYAKSISDAARHRLAGVVAYWVSQRNEENTVFSRFRTRMERAISGWNVDEGIKDAYRFILGATDLDQLSDARASSVVGSLAMVSLIDAYVVVIAALQTVVMNPRNSEAFPTLISIADRFPPEDFRVDKLSALVTSDMSNLTAAETKLVDCLLVPCDSKSIQLTGRAIEACLFADHAHLTSIGFETAGSPWPAGSPAVDFYDLAEAAIHRQSGFARRIDQGFKLLANLRHLAIGRAVEGLIRAQEPHYAISALSAGTLFYLNTPFLHPLHAQVLPRSLVPALCGKFPDSDLAHLTARAAAGEALPASELSVAAREMVGRFRLADNKAETALQYLDFNPTQNEEELSSRRLTPLRVSALLTAGRVEQAIATAAWTCAFDPELAVLLPIEELVEEAKLSGFAIQDKLSLAILLDVYLRRYDEGDAFQPLQFAYEDFVTSNGAKRPSDIARRADVDRTKLIYFLRYIAVPPVMDVSFWLFKRSRDTQAERIAVCSALIELDPVHEALYREEIKEITKVLNIEDGLEDVDRSRVFVNLPKLAQWAESELLESFERYKALTRAGGGFEDPGEFDKALKDLAAGRPAQLERFANYPKDEAGELLLDIYNTFAEKYLHDADFGLDAYLSMRIRHGSLAGHIRGPLEEQGLLAARYKETNTYRLVKSPAVDEFWLSHPEWKAVEGCVEAFSVTFDRLIEDLVKNRLQIKREEKPQGLFSFDPNPLTIYYLRSNIDESASFGDFISRAIEILNIFLDRSLQQVRTFITGTFADGVAHAIDQFERSLEEKASTALCAELRNLVVGASPELQASVERVAAWFAPDKENERRAWRTMEQIVDIAIQATKNAHRGFDPRIETEIEDLGLQAPETLVEFTDILFTILDNIYSHSQKENRPKVKISIVSDKGNDLSRTPVKIRVTNEIAPHAKTPASERRLQRIREQINSGDYRSSVKLEGGTGFLKLKRIVAADNRQTLQFGYNGDREFFVEIKMILVLVETPIHSGPVPS
jgi:hypothetical protein